MNTTIVTALYDIGRGNWPPPFTRSIDSYIEYFKKILSLDANFVIYVDESMKESLLKHRREFDPFLFKTHFICRPLLELETFQKFYTKTKEVMKSNFFLQNRREFHTPESWCPEYNLINFNKVSFVEETVLNNPFGTDYFMWLDAGFSSGNLPINPQNYKYPNPEKIRILDDEKVHFLSFCQPHEVCLDSYFSTRVAIAGSMFAGKATPMLRLKDLSFKVIEEFLDQNAMNDDQTIYSYVYQKDKDLFNLYIDNWFGNFKLFI